MARGPASCRSRGVALNRRAFLFMIPALAAITALRPRSVNERMIEALEKLIAIVGKPLPSAFRNFGSGTLVTLHGEEAVMTRRA